jgi:DNA modification methylase
MRADIQQIKRDLKAFRIEEIFKEELGWDHLREAPSVIADHYRFTPVAEKAGFKIYQHIFEGRIPEAQVLKSLGLKLNNLAAAHLTIFSDASQENQAWLWIKEEQENHRRRLTPRLYRFNKHQSGEALAQQIARLFISLDDEEHITLTSVLDRVYQAFDVERVTTRFYERFKKEHADFMKCIENIPDEDDREWYTSIMLNRLMFVYFIQRKGLLDNYSNVRFEGDQDYLEHRLEQVKREYGSDKFYTFYRHFLKRLFHEGLNQREHPSALERVIGRVPYINGGIFDVHVLEQRYPDIQIRDEAFERLFEFFRGFHWHLDDRPMRNDNEINPDVLGYIFEKYINQKQMGAYYTKEDITGYISKNTIIPFIFEKVAQRCPQAFVAGGPIWSLLRDHPDDYIYEEMAHGWFEPLPAEIAAGIADVTQRSPSWNRTADERYALPTETWREVVERRRRYQEVRDRITGGEINSINDLITYNLNITQFANDVIANCEDPALLRAFYETIEQVTVLDPTCGSGAFLFAALNILKPLYQACIERMRALAEEERRRLAKLPPTQRKESNHITAFRRVLEQVDQRQSKGSQEYFILKSIVVNNLYGVDIMEEAIEICKLRLFLKLVAQIESPQELEPLPDIDFNVLAGNTLIGFTSMDEVRRVVTTKLITMGDTEKMLQLIEQRAQEIERDEQHFRNLQTRYDIEIDSTAISEYKQQLRKKLEDLCGILDPYLATEYAIDKDKDEDAYQKWHRSHKPFHWWAEFYKIIRNGGFDVIIGNPPYVEYRVVNTTYKILTRSYVSESVKNLYAFCMERSSTLLHADGRFGMIVPAGLLGLDEAVSLRKALLQRFGANWFSTFAIRPSKLFEGVDQRLCIHLASTHRADTNIYTTIYHHWSAEERAALFALLRYHTSDLYPLLNRIPQIGGEEAAGVLAKLRAMQRVPLKYYYAPRHSGFLMHYHRSPRYWIRGMDFEQYFKSETRDRSVHHFRDLYFRGDVEGKSIGAILNSSLFFFWFILIGNGRNITGTDVELFPVGPLSETICKELVVLFDKLMDDYKRNSILRVRKDCEFQEFRPSKSKPIIDEIDRTLARHYGFTPEELDFIINYDIKYRMGQDDGGESEE